MENVSESPSPAGTLVSWEEGMGDDKKYHIAHVSPEGVTLSCKMKDYKEWVEVVTAATNSPDNASAMLQEFPKSQFFNKSEIARATYADQLNQLTLIDQNQKKTKIPSGKEQAEVFAAIKQHLGGAESEEEAGAWAVMQRPLFIIAVTGVIGGFAIWFTTMCEPGYEATGRRSGMKNLLNWLGYTIGPTWASVAVGAIVLFVLALMSYQLVKRPIVKILDYSN